MKILRSTDWEPFCYVEDFPDLGPVYVFRNIQYGDITALKDAKYIHVPTDDVYVYCAESRTVVSKADGRIIRDELPEIKVHRKMAI